MRKFIKIAGSSFAKVENINVVVEETAMSRRAAEMLQRGSNATPSQKTMSLKKQVKREFGAAGRWKNDGALWD